MRSIHRRKLILVILIVLLVCAFTLCLGIGRFSVSPIQVIKILLSNFFTIEPTWTKSMYSVIMDIRLPRLFSNCLIGGALALSGVTYQGMFKNPLVSPDLLGVSSGAGVGAACAIFLGLSGLNIQLWAFTFSLLAVGITMFIASRFTSRDHLILVLSGIIISGFMSSVLSFFKYIADPVKSLPMIVFWLMGSMAAVNYQDISLVLLPIVISATILICFSWKINVLSLGSEEAQTLGIDIRKMRGICILCATILTASSVSISGTIGWFGLVIPHIGRLIIGSNHEYLLPASLLLGAISMILLDTLARTVTGGELPMSILTGLVGAPIFTIILLRQRKSF